MASRPAKSPVAQPAVRPQPPAAECWSLYVVRRSDGALYTGIATDVTRRLAEHAGEGGRGAKALRGRGPLTLELSHAVGDRSTAQRLEARIKRLSKARKEHLLAAGALIEHVADDTDAS